MRKTNILSFIRDDTLRAQIDRSRHVTHQMAISPDSPKEFQFSHVKVENILFTKPDHDSKILEYKRIKWYGKGLNLQDEYSFPLRPTLSQIQDKKVNESFQESQSKVIRQRSSKVRYVDKITNRTYDLDTEGRILTQKCAFTENYDLYSKESFKLKSGIFEQFKNAQLLQRRGNQYDTLLKQSYEDYSKTKRKKQFQQLQLDSLNNSISNGDDIIFSSTNQYQNQLNLKIAREQIQNSIRQMRTKRAISYN